MADEKLWNSNYIKVWTGNFLLNFAFMLIVPLLPLYLSETFGAGKDTIGAVLAAYTVMVLLTRALSGYIVDSFSRKLVLMVCYTVFSLLFFGYLIAGSLLVFALFRTLHGAPFGATTVAASTVAIDVLPSSRRGEGIGYYGLSNNLATALGPAIAVYVLQAFGGNFQALFWMSIIVSVAGLAIDSTIRLPRKEFPRRGGVLSWDRFFLLKGWREALTLACYAFSYGVVSTYLAIYGKEELGITSGTGMFFTLFALGLIVSRLTGARSLRRNLVSRNAALGGCVAAVGYLVFAALHDSIGYYLSAFIIGLGNGHMFPAFQNMFINLAPHDRRGTANSSVLSSWDAGVGLGVLLGGVLSEHFGYHVAFWFALGVNVAGLVLYFCRTRAHFEAEKLR